MIGGSITQEIAASPDIVWQVVTDEVNATRILSQLIEQQVVKSSSDNGVGMVVRQVQVWNSRKVESFRTVTFISTSHPPYSISTNIYLNRKHALSNKDTAARTGSWTIVQGKTPHSSIFVWTFSAIPENVVESLLIMMFKKRILKLISKHFQQDLYDFAKEAERRQAMIDEEKKRETSNSGSQPLRAGTWAQRVERVKYIREGCTAEIDFLSSWQLSATGHYSCLRRGVCSSNEWMAKLGVKMSKWLWPKMTLWRRVLWQRLLHLCFFTSSVASFSTNKNIIISRYIIQRYDTNQIAPKRTVYAGRFES